MWKERLSRSYLVYFAFHQAPRCAHNLHLDGWSLAATTGCRGFVIWLRDSGAVVADCLGFAEVCFGSDSGFGSGFVYGFEHAPASAVVIAHSAMCWVVGVGGDGLEGRNPPENGRIAGCLLALFRWNGGNARFALGRRDRYAARWSTTAAGCLGERMRQFAWQRCRDALGRTVWRLRKRAEDRIGFRIDCRFELVRVVGQDQQKRESAPVGCHGRPAETDLHAAMFGVGGAAQIAGGYGRPALPLFLIGSWGLWGAMSGGAGCHS